MNDSAKPVEVDPELSLHALQPQGYSHHNSSKTACAPCRFCDWQNYSTEFRGILVEYAPSKQHLTLLTSYTDSTIHSDKVAGSMYLSSVCDT